MVTNAVVRPDDAVPGLEPDVEAVIKEINGYDVATGRPVGGSQESICMAR